MLKKVILLLLFPTLLAKDPKLLKQCSALQKYQYICREPEIDSVTQQPRGCQLDNSVAVLCTPAPGIDCSGLNKEGEFEKILEDACLYSTGKSHSTALLLSVFLGLLGVDRFYLGYYAMGVVKLCSLGGLFLLYLIDIVLIALQLLGPADGSAYFMPYYGPRVTAVRFNNETYITNYCFDCS